MFLHSFIHKKTRRVPLVTEAWRQKSTGFALWANTTKLVIHKKYAGYKKTAAFAAVIVAEK